MMRKGKVIKIAFVLLLLLIVVKSCFPSGTATSLRVTAEVDTPQGLRTGSSVIEFVSTPEPWWFPGQGGGAMSVSGEAPVVDLGGGKLLYVLLQDQFSSRVMYHFLRADRREPDGTVKPDDYPMLVTFVDPRDVNSVVEVPPANLAAIFGNGYSLRRIFAERVDASATFGRLQQISLIRDHVLPLRLGRFIAANDDAGMMTVENKDPGRLTRASFQLGAPR